MTIMSGAMASRLRTVSSSVSPFVTLEVATAMLSVSALSRFSATSNDVRVRVLGSKKRFTTVRPRRAGTFLIARPPISFIATAVSRRRGLCPSSCRSCLPLDDDFVDPVDLQQPHLHALLERGGQVLADV